ncbi:uncharacterized protein LOC141683409 isoform X1 [Apium graveolens]|uniref:uncharacterized protein LOC141683409 isoform X1 n=2 Tax=Apium graveolens TaxID=4045 RepID=UPI003D7BF9DF
MSSSRLGGGIITFCKQYGSYQRQNLVEDMNKKWKQIVLQTSEIIEKKLAASESLDGIEELLSGGKSSHSPGWLIGRHDMKAPKNPTPNPSDACLQELTKKIRHDVVEEVEEKFNRKLSYKVAKVKKVQDNVSLVLQKLLEANPGLNIDMTQICGTISGDIGADGTPS